jgi:hypothetical protein
VIPGTFRDRRTIPRYWFLIPGTFRDRRTEAYFVRWMTNSSAVTSGQTSVATIVVLTDSSAVASGRTSVATIVVFRSRMMSPNVYLSTKSFTCQRIWPWKSNLSSTPTPGQVGTRSHTRFENDRKGVIQTLVVTWGLDPRAICCMCYLMYIERSPLYTPRRIKYIHKVPLGRMVHTQRMCTYVYVYNGRA